MKISLYILLGCAGLLVVAALLAPPYGFYRFMRIAISIVALYYSYHFLQSSRPFLTFIFLILAVLYNPIYPIYQTRAIWQPINLASAAYFILVAFRFTQPKN